MLHLVKYKTIIKCLHVAFMVMSLNAFAYNIVQKVKSVTDDKNRFILDFSIQKQIILSLKNHKKSF